MVACDDLKIGGTLSSSGIADGMSINNTALSVADWSTLFGTVGMTGSIGEVYGRPGGYLAGDRLPRVRVSTLAVTVHRWPADIQNCTPSDVALMDNTDAFLQEVSKREGTLLEVFLPDGSSRFSRVFNMDPGAMVQPGAFRRFGIPLTAPWGHWWEGGAEKSQAVSGATSLVVGDGSQPIYDAVISFPGNGTFTHSTLGWAIQVVNATGAISVRLGERQAYSGANPISNRIRRTPVASDPRLWGWFTPGSNSVTSTVATTVTWRDQYL